MSAWSERNPNPKSNIRRQDGRVCFYVHRVTLVVSRKTQKTKTVLLTACGDQIFPKFIAGIVLFPVMTTEPLTCPACTAIQGAKNTTLSKPYNPVG